MSLLFHLKNMTPKNCLTCNFSLQYQYILQSRVLENKETYQLDGVKLTQHFSLKIFTEIFVTFAKETCKVRSGTWKSIAHHPLHKLSTQGWIIKQTRFPRLELIWNLAILRNLCMLCVLTDTLKKNVKATYEDQGNNIKRAGPNGDFI